MSILAQVSALREAGRDIVSLTAGEPGAGAPPPVDRAAAAVHSAPTVLNYTAATGLPALRREIAAHYGRWYGTTVSPDRVAVTSGSSGAFMLTFLAAFDPGDRVALARPGYPAYRNILAALGVEVVDLPCGEEQRFQPSVAALEAEVAANGPLSGLIVASPANPTGTMIAPGELQALSAWCSDHEVQLISDEIYHGISYAMPAETALTFGDDAIIVSSFSKYWGMPGWRLGWTILPEQLVDPVARLAGNVSLCPPHPSQLAALEAFSEESMEFARAQVAGYAASRRLVLEALPEIGWGRLAPADGAFYVYAHLGEQLNRYQDAPAYCRALLEEAGVAIVPGTDFDPVDGHEWVRLSLAAGEDAVAEGLRRMAAWTRS